MPGLRVGYLPQEPQLEPEQTVREAVESGMGEVLAAKARLEEVYAAYAEELLRAGRFGAAHAALALAFGRDPNNALYHTLRGRLAEAEGDVGGAVKAYRRAETIQPDAGRGARLEALLTRGE